VTLFFYGAAITDEIRHAVIVSAISPSS